MTCPLCKQAELTASYRDIPYNNLPGVVVKVLYEECPSCGESFVTYDSIAQLDRTILRSLTERQQLSPEEKVFLQKVLEIDNP
jgi:transcriptional regulator NrdR family protein